MIVGKGLLLPFFVLLTQHHKSTLNVFVRIEMKRQQRVNRTAHAIMAVSA